MYRIYHNYKNKTANNEKKSTLQIQRKWHENRLMLELEELIKETIIIVKYMLCLTDTYWFFIYLANAEASRSVVLFNATLYVRNWFGRLTAFK
jgi:hypothetical protein